jgi:hypothetical protein
MDLSFKKINMNNLLKYVILFCVVAGSTFYIPNCNIINEHAVYIGLLAATTFAILDRMFPDIVNECNCNGENENGEYNECTVGNYSNSKIN